MSQHLASTLASSRRLFVNGKSSSKFSCWLRQRTNGPAAPPPPQKLAFFFLLSYCVTPKVLPQLLPGLASPSACEELPAQFQKRRPQAASQRSTFFPLSRCLILHREKWVIIQGNILFILITIFFTV